MAKGLKHALEHLDTAALPRASRTSVTSPTANTPPGVAGDCVAVSTSESVSVVTVYPPGPAIVRKPSGGERKSRVPAPPARSPSVLARRFSHHPASFSSSSPKPKARGALRGLGARLVLCQQPAGFPKTKSGVPVGQVTFTYKVHLEFQPTAVASRASSRMLPVWIWWARVVLEWLCAFLYGAASAITVVLALLKCTTMAARVRFSGATRCRFVCYLLLFGVLQEPISAVVLGSHRG